MRSVHCKHHFLSLYAEFRGDLLHVGFGLSFLYALVNIRVYARSKRFRPSRHLDCTVVTQKSLDFTAYHRHGIRRKSDAILDVKILHRFNEPYCAQLHQIVVFQTPLKTFYDRFYERNILFYQFLFCVVVTLSCALDKLDGGLMV